MIIFVYQSSGTTGQWCELWPQGDIFWLVKWKTNVFFTDFIGVGCTMCLRWVIEGEDHVI